MASERFSTSLPSPRVRGGLMRSARAEEIPDIYWEQAARELDFCTCRKCQVRWEEQKAVNHVGQLCISTNLVSATIINFIYMSCLDRLGTDSISRKIKKLPTVTFYFLWKPRCWCKKYYQTDGLFVHLCESSTSTYQHSSMDINTKILTCNKNIQTL